MKNLRLFALGLLGSATFLTTSCGEDDDPVGPILTVNETASGSADGSVTVAPGETLRFEWDARAGDADLDMFTIRVGGVDQTSYVTENGNSIPHNIGSGGWAAYQDAIEVEASMDPGNTDYVFIIEDADGLTEAETITVIVEEGGTPMNNEVTGAFFHIQGTATGAYNLVDDVQMAVSDPDVEKDMLNTDDAGVTFTGSWETGAGNATSYVQANGFDYANATVEAAQSAFESGSATSTVDNPQEGDIYIAELRGGPEYAVIHITNVDPTDNTCNCANTGIIEFDYKKQ